MEKKLGKLVLKEYIIVLQIRIALKWNYTNSD